MYQLPISAIITSTNEGESLEVLLKTIQFCKEIIVIDLTSEHETKAVAERYATKYIPHKKVVVVEYVRKKIKNIAIHDWILFLDPDEFLTPQINDNLQNIFSSDLNRIGIIELPWRFNFLGKPLKGTIWGGDRKKSALVHRERVIWHNYVHQGIEIKDGFRSYTIENINNNYIHHNWVQSIPKFIEKHLRYICEEGKTRHQKGVRYSFNSHLLYTLRAFKSCFFDAKGYRDGLIGFGLSCFWVWYEYSCWASLRKYQKQIENPTKAT